MNAYKILTPYSYSQTYIVVAENMGKAEEIFKEKHNFIEIIEITLISQYVDVQPKKREPK